MSEVRSALTGRIVDSYTNILTVKLFARPRDEDEFVRAAVDEHTVTFRRQLRLITLFSLTLTLLNASMVVGHRRGGRLALDQREDPRGRRRHGAAAHLADRQYRGLGGAERDGDLRERRRGAGRHALDLGAAR